MGSDLDRGKREHVLRVAVHGATAGTATTGGPAIVKPRNPDRAMSPRTLLLAALFVTVAVGAAPAQEQPKPSSRVELPEACRTAAAADDADGMAQPEEAPAAEAGDDGFAGLTPTQRALWEAMMAMDEAMATGMMAEDADLAWICAMIPHHQGAIDMARAGLLGADDEDSKRLARKTIEDNEKSIAELVEWVQKHGKTQSGATGSTGPAKK